MAAVVHPARTNNKAGKTVFVIAAPAKEVHVTTGYQPEAKDETR
jgi:hypothetical protein